MGKYIRKPKTSADAAGRDASQTYLGVRTRAKTLALQRLHPSSSAAAAAADVSSPLMADYLELRSRRLEKPPLPGKNNLQNSRKAPVSKENPHSEKSAEESPAGPSALPIEPPGEVHGEFQMLNGGYSEIGDSEFQTSLGEDANLDLDARERSTRESTPSSYIRSGSSTRPRSPNSRAQSAARELEEFFARAEQAHQRRFMDKYNFDIANDAPLHGRYEWVKVLP